MMCSLGVNKTVLLGRLSREPQLHYGREGQARALLSLSTRVAAVGAQGDLAGTLIDDAHLIYCEGELAERARAFPSGALVYLEGRNREQKMADPGRKSFRLAYVSALIVRHLNNASASEGANCSTLVGTILRDPVSRHAADGQCESVMLHVTTIQRQQEDASEPPHYSREHHAITFYGRLAAFVLARCREGSLVYVEGRNQPSRWQDADGLTHRTITIVGHYFQLLYSAPVSPHAPELNLEIAGYDVQLPEEVLARNA